MPDNDLTTAPKFKRPAKPTTVAGAVEAARLYGRTIGYHAGKLALSSFELGWYVLQVSRSQEVQTELKARNEGRRGRPWEPHRLAAALIVEQGGDDVPSLDWLGKCAQAALKAKELGVDAFKFNRPERFTNSLMGLAPSIRAMGNPLALLPSGDDDHGADDGAPDPVRAIQQTFEFMDTRVQKLAAIAGRQRLPKRELRKQMDRLNKSLNLLGLVIVDKQGGRKK